MIKEIQDKGETKNYYTIVTLDIKNAFKYTNFLVVIEEFCKQIGSSFNSDLSPNMAWTRYLSSYFPS